MDESWQSRDRQYLVVDGGTPPEATDSEYLDAVERYGTRFATRHARSFSPNSHRPDPAGPYSESAVEEMPPVRGVPSEFDTDWAEAAMSYIWLSACYAAMNHGTESDSLSPETVADHVGEGATAPLTVLLVDLPDGQVYQALAPVLDDWADLGIDLEVRYPLVEAGVNAVDEAIEWLTDRADSHPYWDDLGPDTALRTWSRNLYEAPRASTSLSVDEVSNEVTATNYWLGNPEDETVIRVSHHSQDRLPTARVYQLAPEDIPVAGIINRFATLVDRTDVPLDDCGLWSYDRAPWESSADQSPTATTSTETSSAASESGSQAGLDAFM